MTARRAALDAPSGGPIVETAGGRTGQDCSWLTSLPITLGMTTRSVFWMGADGALVTPLPGQMPHPVMVWEQTDGRWRPGSVQETTSDGIPVWGAIVAVSRVAYGRVEPDLVEVRWASSVKPTEPPAASPWGGTL